MDSCKKTFVIDNKCRFVIEIGELWQCKKVVVIPIIIATLGAWFGYLRPFVCIYYPRYSNHLNKINKMRYKTEIVTIIISEVGSYFELFQLLNLYSR